jgi:23S rRNA (cytosine1962-C5)-methyltransferase
MHTDITNVYLKRGKEAAVKRFHPWIFSGAIHHMDGEPKDGDWVKVMSHKEEVIATGHYNNGSIMVRILAFGETEITEDFWNDKLTTAFAKRKSIVSLQDTGTDCFRLIHAEGDNLPGLIVDVYGEVAVLQCHSIGMHKDRKKIAAAVLSQSDGSIKYIYDKSTQVLPRQYSFNFKNGFMEEGREEVSQQVQENGQPFVVNWETGQKTGFFLDQRDNRKLLGDYAKGKTVLNTFCYSGGFSIYALNAGATLVHSVDVSQKAMDLTDENVALNAPFDGEHVSYTEDVMTFFKENEEEYDVVVVDPPAFAKNLRKKHNAVQGYKRLNTLALNRVKKGGILFTFSCSQVIDTLLFQNTIVAAALETNRKVSILHRLTQPADHPVNLFHPEGAYLKGLVLYVE